MPVLCFGVPAGHSQPDHQVVAVAISSGLVTYPLGFVRVWESPGGFARILSTFGAQRTVDRKPAARPVFSLPAVATGSTILHVIDAARNPVYILVC